MDNKKIIAVIPARGGSKGLPNKNILRIKGKTLIEIAIKQASLIKGLDEIVFSSDSKNYCQIAKEAGASVLGLRSASLSRDSTKTIEVLKDLTKYFPELNTILLLQPTSPIRSVDEIQKALDLSIFNRQTVISVARVEEPHPSKLFYIDDENKENELKPFIKHSKFNSETPRQELPPVYRLTGAFYCINVNDMRIQNRIVSDKAIGQITTMYPNIDKLEDFEYINWMIEREKPLPKDFLKIIS